MYAAAKQIRCSQVTSASFSPDGSRDGSNMTVRVQEVQAGAELPTVKHHSFAVTSASFNPAERASVAQTWAALRNPIFGIGRHTGVASADETDAANG